MEYGHRSVKVHIKPTPSHIQLITVIEDIGQCATICFQEHADYDLFAQLRAHRSSGNPAAPKHAACDSFLRGSVCRSKPPSSVPALAAPLRVSRICVPSACDKTPKRK